MQQSLKSLRCGCAWINTDIARCENYLAKLIPAQILQRPHCKHCTAIRTFVPKFSTTSISHAATNMWGCKSVSHRNYEHEVHYLSRITTSTQLNRTHIFRLWTRIFAPWLIPGLHPLCWQEPVQYNNHIFSVPRGRQGLSCPSILHAKSFLKESHQQLGDDVGIRPTWEWGDMRWLIGWILMSFSASQEHLHPSRPKNWLYWKVS